MNGYYVDMEVLVDESGLSLFEDATVLLIVTQHYATEVTVPETTILVLIISVEEKESLVLIDK